MFNILPLLLVGPKYLEFKISLEQRLIRCAIINLGTQKLWGCVPTASSLTVMNKIQVLQRRDPSPHKLKRFEGPY